MYAHLQNKNANQINIDIGYKNRFSKHSVHNVIEGAQNSCHQQITILNCES